MIALNDMLSLVKKLNELERFIQFESSTVANALLDIKEAVLEKYYEEKK
jgi:hypothetical protein